MNIKSSAVKDKANKLGRRQFLKNAGAAALAFTIVEPQLVRGSAANSKIKLGLVGCGGRGTWLADLFQKHGGYQFTAAADYFQDKVDAFGEQYKIDKNQRFTGLNGYKKLLAGKAVDAIIIQTPPYFHPEQAAAGVEAGVHVYLAKPIAVDVPGCMSIQQSAQKAGAQKLCFLVDFQTRTHPFYREAVKRVQYGDIGKIVSGEAAYLCDATWSQYYPFFENGNISPENRLRAWGLSRELSGDVITEQNIHVLDVATWILDEHPLQATGFSYRYRPVGTCHDTNSVIYTFPGDVLLTFHSKQFGKAYDDLLCRMYGANGVIDTHYFGSVSISGDKPFKGGDVGNLYTDGAVSNIADFHANITSGKYANTTVAPSVRSNLTTIMGRLAADKGAPVSWEEVSNSQATLTPDLTGLVL
ncbi:MAG TPA: Gfo/Idh/MocA family oxidoreductase [bacterium]|nr:Gfo/Idh/MocA family oxidoreductase [bacterium]HPN45059.1 Gfo/Idh/MocA family oxidoreductase [bacterium]